MDEVELFARGKRRRRVLGGLTVVAVVGSGVLLYPATRPSACEQLAAAVCEIGDTGCAETLGEGLESKIPEQACAQTLEDMREALRSTPPDLAPGIKASALRLLLEDQLGVDPLEVGRAAAVEDSGE